MYIFITSLVIIFFLILPKNKNTSPAYMMYGGFYTQIFLGLFFRRLNPILAWGVGQFDPPCSFFLHNSKVLV